MRSAFVLLLVGIMVLAVLLGRPEPPLPPAVVLSVQPTPTVHTTQTLAQFARAASAGNAVMILGTVFSGLSTLRIDKKPVYAIAFASVDREGAHKNRFSLVTLNAASCSSEEVYNIVFMAQVLSTPGARLIVTSLAPSTLDALYALVKDGVIELGIVSNNEDTWASGMYKDVKPNKAMSEYLCDVIKRVLGPSELTYYVTSRDREAELRKFYANDKSITVTNVTGVFHAAVLKVLFQNINIVFDPKPAPRTAEAPSPGLKGITPKQPPATENAESLRFEKAKDFFTRYIT